MLIALPEIVFRRAAQCVFALVAILIFLTFDHYGISWDEEIQNQYGQAIRDYYVSGLTDRRYGEIYNLYLYGGMFDGLAAFFSAYTPVTVYETRHLLNALTGLIGLWGTWRLGRLLQGGFVGLMAVLLLVLTPMYYGHSFNNPKDIPFAAGVVWSLYYMAKNLMSFPQIKPSVIVKLGIIIGLTLGVRVNGIMLLGFWGLVLTATAFVRLPTLKLKDVTRTILSLAKVGLSVGVIAYLFMLLCWPWAQEAPLENPLRAVFAFSNFPQNVEVLLDRTTYLSTELPWFYVPLYFVVQVPLLQLLFIASAFFGFIGLLRRARPIRGKAPTLVLMMLVAGFPLFYAIARRPALYDAVRHFIFVLPLFYIMGSMVFESLGSRLMTHIHHLRGPIAKKMARLGFVGIILVLMVLPLGAMIALHPYEYIYVNELDGGVQGAFGEYELDYWGSSFKEAGEKLQAYVNAHGGVPPGEIYRVAICGSWSAFSIHMPPNYEHVPANEPAEFFLATTRWMCHNMREGKEVVRVERMGAPLSIIKDLRGIDPPK